MPVLGTLLVVGSAVLLVVALAVVTRFVPAALREPHNDVVGFVYAVVGVIYAVILAMVVIGVWESLEKARSNTYAEANALVQVDWYAHSLPEPVHGQMQALTKEYAEAVIHDEWPLLSHQQASPKAAAAVTELRALIVAQQPSALADAVRYQQALTAATELSTARGERVNQAGEGIPRLLWSALLVGGLVTVGFAFTFGMSSLRAHAAIVFSLTLLIGYILLVVYELNYPFAGLAKVEPRAFELALQRMLTIT